MHRAVNNPEFYHTITTPEGRTRTVIEPEFEGEGYVVIRCGDIEVQVGATVWHSVCNHFIIRDSSLFVPLAKLSRVFDQIENVAMAGGKGD